MLPLDALGCLRDLNIYLPHVASDIVIFGAQVIENVVHSGVDMCGDLVQRFSLNLLTLEHLLHHRR